MNNNGKLSNCFVLVFIALFVVGCTNTSTPVKKTNHGRYKVDQDYGPQGVIDVSHVADAVPVVEPRSRGGNRSRYEVFGKTYSVLSTSNGFKERGGASWYGKKFHGYLTANGEKYDMFGMTAAHKSLPIPTYLKVTNLANQKHVIVRVNDRGPFHKGRVVDLSYAAASKLDMLNSGTAQVEIEAIDPVAWQKKNRGLSAAKHKLKIVDNLANGQQSSGAQVNTTLAQKNTSDRKVIDANPKFRGDAYKGIHYVQVGVYSTDKAAHNVTMQVKEFGPPALISEISRVDRKLYKVIIGPMKTRSQTTSVISELEGLGFSGAHLIDLPK